MSYKTIVVQVDNAAGAAAVIGVAAELALREQAHLIGLAAVGCATEMFAMIFKKAPNVTVVGSQTAGADGNETPIPLVDGESMIFSGRNATPTAMPRLPVIPCPT